jgi:hypothetical protein
MSWTKILTGMAAAAWPVSSAAPSARTITLRHRACPGRLELAGGNGLTDSASAASSLVEVVQRCRT